MSLGDNLTLEIYGLEVCGRARGQRAGIRTGSTGPTLPQRPKGGRKGEVLVFLVFQGAWLESPKHYPGAPPGLDHQLLLKAMALSPLHTLRKPSGFLCNRERQMLRGSKFCPFC